MNADTRNVDTPNADTRARSLAGKTLLISGGSRGIGHAIAVRAARDGANVALLAKTAQPHATLPGTVYSAAEDIERAGGTALPCVTDIRDEAAVAEAVAATRERFGGIDILVNNASAISLTGTLDTPVKRFDLMHQVNARGTFVCSQACLPALLQAPEPHILTLAPPLNLNPRWFAPHLAYSMAKYGMSLCVLGLAEEYRGRIAVNALWPRTLIATAALAMLPGSRPQQGRSPEIVADAAHWILTRRVDELGGEFLIDDEVLHRAGVQDLERYAVEPGAALEPDIFLD